MEHFEDIHAMEREETKDKLPIGWLLLFVGLIIFTIYYSAAFNPAVTGWTQDKEYKESLKQK
jgi:hypothetical protein